MSAGVSAAAGPAPARPDLSFVQIAQLDVLHAYFQNGAARDLAFLPLASTRAFLNANAVQLRSNGSSLALQAESGRLQDLWAERTDEQGQARCLEFRVISRDPLSQIYTAPSAQVPTFGPGASPSGALSLSTAAPTPPAGAPDVKQAPTLPLASVRLPLVPAGVASLEAWQSKLGGAYSLSLEARATVWKYILLGDWSSCSPLLADLAGQVTFETPQAATLENGSPVLVSRSLQTIPLGESPPQKFQLKDSSAQPPRILIKRLPVASPGRFYRESMNGSPAFVSEIFIHR